MSKSKQSKINCFCVTEKFVGKSLKPTKVNNGKVAVSLLALQAFQVNEWITHLNASTIST